MTFSGNCPTSKACSFEVFDAATAAIEAHRPCTVSCAYIVAFAARDAAYLASGVDYSVPAGRRDGRASLEPEALNHIPLPNLRDRFADKGLSLDDIVALSGTNSIGRSHCTSFAPRLYNFSAARPQDPGFAACLKSKCPPPTTDVNSGDPTTVSLDAATPTSLDNRYYKNLLRHRGGGLCESSLSSSSRLSSVSKLYHVQWVFFFFYIIL
ncbi:peroxidase 5-like [Musa acuminata AAA Group]|uniref:peroxidase 5-like n=1 Tax=Musa acuminata AAA Group TaxID=214697 RepID=UPI0031DE0DA9